MNLNKENLKKIRGLIVFTVILLIALWNYSLILDVLGQGVGIVYPFLLGGAIAFVINVPMSFFEEKLFQNQMMKNKKVAQRLARPISLIITLIVVVSVIGLVVFGVLPKLGDTFISIGKGIQSFMPKAQSWAEEIFHNNKEIKEWLDSLTLDWDKIINEVVKFFTSGASQRSWLYVCSGKKDCQWNYNLCDCVCFCVLRFVAERKIKYSDPESDVCIHERRSGEKGSGCLFSELPYIFEFPDRTVSGGRDSGNDVCDLYGNPADAICDAHWCSDRVYCADSDFRGIYWLRSGSISDSDGGADEGFGFCDHVPDPSADRGKSDLSESGGQFCGTSVYLGAGSGQYRSQSDGNRGNAGFHSNRFRAVCTSPWGCL